MTTLKNKAQVIKQINKVGIKDIECNTFIDREITDFCITITTNDGHSYHFSQVIVPKLIPSTTEVIYFDESGNGQYVADLGPGISRKPKKKKSVTTTT